VGSDSNIEKLDAEGMVRSVSRFWWIILVVGVLWLAASYVILQFNDASLKTIGVIAGVMFVVLGLQNIVLATLADRFGWIWGVFGVLFLIAGVFAFVYPMNTFAAIADILGLLFFMVGVFWLIGSIATKDVNDFWWIGLIAGILMLVLAFWTSGQFFIEKSYVLVVFAGIWALMQGITDIVRAFQIRRLGRVV
jgi:uncharacterized membrane protein HdeD (DUF308 family)